VIPKNEGFTSSCSGFCLSECTVGYSESPEPFPPTTLAPVKLT
jgi:hypothetical protein